MKLCNYRHHRSREGRCWLKCSDIRPSEKSHSMPVFQPDGSGELVKWSPELKAYSYPLPRFDCTEQMAKVCPYRVHSPRSPSPKAKWYDCPNCEHRHRTERARILCAGYAIWNEAFDKWKKEFSATPFLPEGTRKQVYPQELLAFPGFTNMVRDYLWPIAASAVTNRDQSTCQDCQSTVGPFEVHHIIPRGLGGSDHPANLKLVCKNCHQKYNEKFNGQIISQRARERKITALQKGMKTLDGEYPRER